MTVYIYEYVSVVKSNVINCRLFFKQYASYRFVCDFSLSPYSLDSLHNHERTSSTNVSDIKTTRQYGAAILQET